MVNSHELVYKRVPAAKFAQMVTFLEDEEFRPKFPFDAEKECVWFERATNGSRGEAINAAAFRFIRIHQTEESIESGHYDVVTRICYAGWDKNGNQYSLSTDAHLRFMRFMDESILPSPGKFLKVEEIMRCLKGIVGITPVGNIYLKERNLLLADERKPLDWEAVFLRIYPHLKDITWQEFDGCTASQNKLLENLARAREIARTIE